MAEDMSVLVDDVSDITAAVNAIVVTRAKIQGHKPNLFLHFVSKGIKHMAEIGDFSEYTPRNIDLVRQMNEAQLAEFIFGMHELIIKRSDLPEKTQKERIIRLLGDANEKAFKK
jgi:hypothetical protein